VPNCVKIVEVSLSGPAVSYDFLLLEYEEEAALLM